MYPGIPLSDFDDLSRQIQFKLEIYFDGLSAAPVVIQGSDKIMSVSILEELSSDIQSFLGNASANEYVIQIDDMQQEFSPEKTTGYGPKIKTGIPIKIFARATPTKAWVPMGFGYVELWQSVKASNIVTITAYDSLYKILNDEMPVLPTKTDESITNFLTRVFTALGIGASQFQIDASFNTVNLPYTFANAGKVGATIQSLLLAAMAYMYVDRSGIIRVIPWVKRESIVHTLTDSLHVFSPNSQLGLYAPTQAPRVNYKALAVVPGVVVDAKQYKIPPGVTLIRKLKPSSQPILDCEFVYVNTQEAEVETIEVGSNYINLEMRNTSAATKGVDFQITCNVLRPIEIKIADLHGLSTGNVITSVFVQEASKAESIQQIVDKNVASHVPYMDVSNRGNCALELGDFIRINCPSVSTDYKGRLYRIKWKYDGSLEATYTLVNSDILGGN